MSSHDVQTASAILARLIARAYAAEHPEFFGEGLHEVLGLTRPCTSWNLTPVSGPPC